MLQAEHVEGYPALELELGTEALEELVETIVLPGPPHPGRPDPGEMVEPHVLDLDVVGIDAEIVAEAALGPDGDVAQADGAVALVEQGLGDDPHRIGEVDEPGARVGPGRHLLGQLEDDRHGAQRLGQPARADGLLAQTSITDRERLVDVASRLPPDAQLDDDEVGSFEGGVRIGRGPERPAPTPLPQDALREPPDDFASLVARIEQDEIVDDHAVLLIAESVDQLRGVRAPAAHDGHLGPHERNVISEHARAPDAEPAVLAFDGGSTKTDVVLVSRDGAVLGRARVGPSNHQLVGLEGTVESLGAAIAAVSEDANLDGRPRPVCPIGVYCLAGIDLPVDEDKLAPAIDARGGRSTPSCATTPSPSRGRARRRRGESASSAARG